eukprot:4144639-Pleurochrysis_carterae.AAC.1
MANCSVYGQSSYLPGVARSAYIGEGCGGISRLDVNARSVNSLCWQPAEQVLTTNMLLGVEKRFRFAGSHWRPSHEAIRSCILFASRDDIILRGSARDLHRP